MWLSTRPCSDDAVLSLRDSAGRPEPLPGISNGIKLHDLHSALPSLLSSALCTHYCTRRHCILDHCSGRMQQRLLFGYFDVIVCTYSVHDVPLQMQEAARGDITFHNVTLDHQQSEGHFVPVNFTFTYPVDEPATKMPMVMLLNGANVESYWYRRLIAQLASTGYVVASSDLYRPFKVTIPQLPSTPSSRVCPETMTTNSPRLFRPIWCLCWSMACPS